MCKHYSKRHYRIHLLEDALAHNKWWNRLFSDWNCKSFLSSRWKPALEIQLFTDASRIIGCRPVPPEGVGGSDGHPSQDCMNHIFLMYACVLRKMKDDAEIRRCMNVKYRVRKYTYFRVQRSKQYAIHSTRSQFFYQISKKLSKHNPDNYKPTL